MPACCRSLWGKSLRLGCKGCVSSQPWCSTRVVSVKLSSLPLLLSLKWVNLYLQNTLKHLKYLCRYDHIFVKFCKIVLMKLKWVVDEVCALDLLFAVVLMHRMVGGGWNSNCIACCSAGMHAWAVHIDMDMTTRGNTTACVLQGRGNSPR